MNEKCLRDMATIEISGVDKKTKDNEKPVSLCNFTDVYNNWEITNSMVKNFMKASATDKEIERFSLKKGMLAITKDSETKNDIGITTLINEDLENTVLGYHTAMICPDEKIVDSSYLNGYLSSERARKYFSNQASGSGQRYTLSVDGIGAVKVLLPDIQIQRNIGRLLSGIERKIRVNSRINDNLSFQSVMVT